VRDRERESAGERQRRGVVLCCSIMTQKSVASFSHTVIRAMFEVDMRERDDGAVTLGNQSPGAVDSFLDFAYTGEAVVTDKNVDMLFQLASFLQVQRPPHSCAELI